MKREDFEELCRLHDELGIDAIRKACDEYKQAKRDHHDAPTSDSPRTDEARKGEGATTAGRTEEAAEGTTPFRPDATGEDKTVSGGEVACDSSSSHCSSPSLDADPAESGSAMTPADATTSETP